MSDYMQLTTSELIDRVQADGTATERELALLDRLHGALDEVDRLVEDDLDGAKAAQRGRTA